MLKTEDDFMVQYSPFYLARKMLIRFLNIVNDSETYTSVKVCPRTYFREQQLVSISKCMLGSN